MAKASKRISDDDVLAIVRPMIDTATEHERVLADQRADYLRWYRAAPYGNERPGWSQTVHPTILSAVEWMKPGLVEVFTGDFFDLVPVVKTGMDKAAAQAGAKRLKTYIRHKLFNELEGEQQLEDFMHDAMVYHYGVMKVTQREDYDVVTEDWSGSWEEAAAQMQADPNIRNIEPLEETEIPDMATGQTVPYVAKGRLTRRVVKYAGFHIESVPPSELRKTPGYKALDECPLVAHVVKRSLDYIRRQERAGVYRKGSAQKVEDAVNSGEEDTVSSIERREALALDGQNDLAEGDYDYGPGASGDYAKANTRVEVWECYVKLDLDGTGLLKPAIVTICGDVVLRSPVENPYGGPPFEIGSLYREPHKIEGLPVPAVLDHRQRVLSNLLRNIQDAAAVSTYQNWLTTDTRTKKMLASMGPGDVGLVPQLSVVQEIKASPPPAFVLNAFQLTLQEAAKESGVNENMQGLDNNALNHTAAGMSMRLTAGMQRQKLYARRLARTFKRIIGRVLDIIRLYPPEDDIRILGEDVALSRDDIGGRYTVTIDVGIGPQDKQAKAQALDTLLQFQLAAGQGVGITPDMIVETLRAKFDALDIDIAPYLPTPEESRNIPGQVQQMGQQLQQANGQIQGLQQALDEHKQALAQANTDQQKFALEVEKLKADYALKLQELNARLELERLKIDGNFRLKAMSEAAQSEREQWAVPSASTGDQG